MIRRVSRILNLEDIHKKSSEGISNFKCSVGRVNYLSLMTFQSMQKVAIHNGEKLEKKYSCIFKRLQYSLSINNYMKTYKPEQVTRFHGRMRVD